MEPTRTGAPGAGPTPSPVTRTSPPGAGPTPSPVHSSRGGAASLAPKPPLSRRQPGAPGPRESLPQPNPPRTAGPPVAPPRTEAGLPHTPVPPRRVPQQNIELLPGRWVPELTPLPGPPHRPHRRTRRTPGSSRALRGRPPCWGRDARACPASEAPLPCGNKASLGVSL